VAATDLELALVAGGSAVAGAFMGSLLPVVDGIATRRAAKRTADHDRGRAVFSDYLRWAMSLRDMIIRVVPLDPVATQDAIRGSYDHLLDVEAVLRLTAPRNVIDATQDFRLTWTKWNDRMKELSDIDLALPRDQRRGVQATTMQAFDEVMGPKLDVIERAMRKHLGMDS
jgi:hypothetical protein